MPAETRELLPNGWIRVVKEGFCELWQKHMVQSWYEKRVDGTEIVDFLTLEARP